MSWNEPLGIPEKGKPPLGWKPRSCDTAMGQKPVPPVNIPIPTKIGSKWVVHRKPQNGIPLVLTYCHTTNNGLPKFTHPPQRGRFRKISQKRLEKPRVIPQPCISLYRKPRKPTDSQNEGARLGLTVLAKVYMGLPVFEVGHQENCPFTQAEGKWLAVRFIQMLMSNPRAKGRTMAPASGWKSKRHGRRLQTSTLVWTWKYYGVLQDSS